MNADLLMILNKAKSSLQAAELLIRDGYYEFAASRAYYAMLYVAEALLLNLGQSYSSHSGVIGAFGHEFAKTGRMDAGFHRWLIQAQNYRTTSDYDFDRHLSLEQAQEVCAWAKEFIAAGESYLGEKGDIPDYGHFNDTHDR